MEEAGINMPVWAQLAIALGGIELLKWLYEITFHRKSNHKRADAEANQITAEANQADVDYRQKEMELISQQIDFNKNQLAGLREEYHELLEEKKAIKAQYKSVKVNYSELARKVDGLQKAFNEAFATEVAKKKEAEYNICYKDNCKMREPKRGTYVSTTAEVPRIDMEAAKMALLERETSVVDKSFNEEENNS